LSKPAGVWGRVSWGRVRVGIYVPLKNPYPWQGSRVSTRPKKSAYINLKMVFFFYFSVQNFILNF